MRGGEREIDIWERERERDVVWGYTCNDKDGKGELEKKKKSENCEREQKWQNWKKEKKGKRKKKSVCYTKQQGVLPSCNFVGLSMSTY